MKNLARLILASLLFSIPTFGQGTQTWQQTSYEDFSKGTTKGIAIRSEGSLTTAPAFDTVYTSPSTYIWCAAADPDGGVFIGTGAPARVYHVQANGTATVIFEPKELQVQALALDKEGTLYAATSPDGKIYKLTQAKKGSDYTANVFFDPKTKYIWSLALDKNGNVFAGTGDRGEIFRVNKSGEGTVFFKSDEAHIRTMAFDATGNLIAGSDGSGLVYRISPGGEGFVLYSAAKKEITALAMDAAGNIYAAGVGEKHSGLNLNQGANIPVAPIGPAGIGPAISGSPGPLTGGSDVYVISADGSPRRLWTTKDDIVYALGLDPQGRVLAGTGNKGRVVAIEKDGTFSELTKASANQITAFAPAPKGGTYAVTSNLGKVLRLGANADQEGSFESDVFDAKNFSRWGRAEVRGSGNFEFFARSGNVDNPDRNWSTWKRVDLGKDALIDAPPARFVQWKLVIPAKSHAVLESVKLNYRAKNVAPVVEEVVVQTGAKVSPGSVPKPSNDSVTINLASQSQNNSSGTMTRFDPPLTAQKDKGSITARWAAHDDNDDDLIYSLYYRGDGESRWKLLKDKITDKYYSWDASLLPDGGYTLRVLASDSPSHSPDEALTDAKESARFEVDTTPPRIDNLTAKPDGGRLRVTFTAHDTFSPIRRAEYSLDAGDWQFVEPTGLISDSPTEAFDFKAALPPPDSSDTSTEHIVVVRVYDRFENMGIAKVVVK